MKNYKFTYIEKKYYDVEIQAEDHSKAREIFDMMLYNDKLNWENPDYCDSETYFEETQEV